MTSYNDNDDSFLSEPAGDDGLNTMAVLSTLGGGDDATPEGEPLGIDPEDGKAKLSGSTLAVGVVIVLGAVTLLGMKLTLGAMGTGSGPSEAMNEIEIFIAQHNAARQVGVDGPISAPDEESKKVLEDLKQDPNANQVPPEEVEGNPFDFSELFDRPAATTDDRPQQPTLDQREVAVQRAKDAASRLSVDGISGKIVFIDGKDYRVGETIGDGTFELTAIDGLTCIIRTTDEHRIALRLKYR